MILFVKGSSCKKQNYAGHTNQHDGPYGAASLRAMIGITFVVMCIVSMLTSFLSIFIFDIGVVSRANESSINSFSMIFWCY